MEADSVWSALDVILQDMGLYAALEPLPVPWALDGFDVFTKHTGLHTLGPYFWG